MKKTLPPIAAFPHVHWSHNWERIHEMISRLAAHSPSVCIHSPYGLISPSPLSVVKKFLDYANQKQGSGSKNPLPENATLSGGFFIPFQYNALFDAFNFRQIQSRNPVPFQHSMVYATYANGFITKALRQSKISILDLTQRRQTDPLLSSAAKATEAKAVKIATLVMADNHSVMEDYRNLRDDILYLPQGVDDYRFSMLKEPAEEILKIKSKFPLVAGYCGTDKALDLDFYASLIQTQKEVAFVYAGKLMPENEEILSQHHNFFYLGNKNYQALPSVYRAFDCGLIPYKVNDFTQGVFPTKMLEYLASGVPVLSTPLPEVLPFSGDVVCVSESPQEASHSLVKLMRSKPSLQDKCISLAQENTWKKRIETLLERLKPHLLQSQTHG